MKEEDSPMENQNDDFTNKLSTDNEYSKWVDNQGDEVKNVFGFNSSAELVNGRAAMVGFCLLYTSPSPRDRTRSRMPSSA